MSPVPHRKALGLFLIAGVALSCSDPGTAPVTEPSVARSVSTRSAAPSSPGWQEQARLLVAANRLTPLQSARVFAALSVAQYLAVVEADGHFAVEGALPEHGLGVGGRRLLEGRRGAVAGASAEVLAFFFPAPADIARLEARVQAEAEAGAGGVHPQFTRGLEVGRRAGAALVERARNDHFTAPWTGTVPPGLWVSAPPGSTPAGATFAGVTPYLLTSSNQFRPPPPPAVGSPAFQADLAEIRTLTSPSIRTPEQLASAEYWNFKAGTFTPPGYWNLTAAANIQASALDERAATHVFALMHAAIIDAQIACYEAKYVYWTPRPWQVDPSIIPNVAIIPFPNHPSYPSGHSCHAAAAAAVLSHFFPDRAAELEDVVTQMGLSRMYAGIHYRFDISAAVDLGNAVATWAVAVDESTGLLAAMR